MQCIGAYGCDDPPGVGYNDSEENPDKEHAMIFDSHFTNSKPDKHLSKQDAQALEALCRLLSETPQHSEIEAGLRS